ATRIEISNLQGVVVLGAVLPRTQLCQQRHALRSLASKPNTKLLLMLKESRPAGQTELRSVCRLSRQASGMPGIHLASLSPNVQEGRLMGPGQHNGSEDTD
ncbi:MAG: hypothetical protein WCC14_21010, partial [Acidobacteriaceae bacterium]